MLTQIENSERTSKPDAKVTKVLGKFHNYSLSTKTSPTQRSLSSMISYRFCPNTYGKFLTTSFSTMSYKIDFRKSIYNSIGQMPKSIIVNMFQDSYISRTKNFRPIGKCDEYLVWIYRKAKGLEYWQNFEQID